MSFSASTCLRYTGLPPLGTTINIYSNSDSYVTIVATVPTSDITGGNCPYNLLLPDGTTNIKLVDPTSGCYSIVPIKDNNLCVTCDLDFNFYSGTTIGRIIVGDLTGSCQSSIASYIINWYGPGAGSTDVAFKSGKGTAFTGYQFTHPLTGSSAVLAQEGVYTPVIDKILIDNIRFSQTGGTGYVQADLECFDAIPVTIEGYACDNGGTSSNLSQYEHRVLFEGASSGAESPPLSATFNLSANTNYFAWKFKGNVVPDKLKLTFIGSAYSDPIILEYWDIGTNGPDVFVLGNLPYSAYTSTYVNKITVLTGLTRNLGDKIIMEVTPNTVNPQTNWDFYFTCLETFNCEYPPISKTPYKISGDTILLADMGCSQSRVGFSVTGCTTSELADKDLVKYLLGDYTEGGRTSQISSTSGLISTVTPYYLHWGQSQCTNQWFIYRPPVCSVANSNTITYKKYVSGGDGKLEITFSDLSDLEHYYSSYQSILSYSGTPFDNTDIDYYRAIYLYIPNNVGGTNCGDGTSTIQYPIHYSSIVTTGGTGPFTMNITMKTVSDGMNFSSCDVRCSGYTTEFVVTTNTYTTGTSYNYTGTTNTGSKFIHPFGSVLGITGPNIVPAVTASTIIGYTIIKNTILFTNPVSGSTSPYVMLPGLSGVTCPNISNDFYAGNPNGLTNDWLSYCFYYSVELTNPLVPKAYNIYASPISSNGEVDILVSSKILVYTYNGTTATYTNPAYIV